MVTRSLLIVIALLWLPSGLAGQTESMPFYRFSLSEGLPDAYVFEVSEDYGHGIWLATRGGLVRMHGPYPEVFTVQDGLSRNDIRSVVHMTDGSAWIITSGSLSRMAADHTFSEPEQPLIKEQRMLSGVADRQGNFWCVGANQVFCVNPGGVVKAFSRQDIGAQGVWATEKCWEGEGMLLSAENGLFHLTHAGLQHRWEGTLPVSEIKGVQLPRVSVLPDHTYIVQVSAGVAFVNHELQSVDHAQNFWLPEAGFPLLVSQTVSDASICLTRNNVSLFDTGSFARALKSLSGPSRAFLNGLIDQEGNLWMATHGEGVWMLSVHYLNQSVRELRWRERYEPLINGKITAIGHLNHSLLIGTDQGEVLMCGPDSSALWEIPGERQVEQIFGGPGKWVARCGQSLMSSAPGSREVQEQVIPGLSALFHPSDEALMVNQHTRFHFRLPWSLLDELMQTAEVESWMNSSLAWVQVAFSREAVQTADGRFVVTLDDGISFPDSTGNQDLLAGDAHIRGEYPDLALWGQDTVVTAAGPAGIQLFYHGKKVWPMDGADAWPYGVVRNILVDSASETIWALTNLGLVRFHGIPAPGSRFPGYLITEAEGFMTSEPDDLTLLDEWVVILKDGIVCPVRVPDLKGFHASPVLKILCMRWPGSGCRQVWEGRKVIQRDSASLDIQLVSNMLYSPDNQVIEYRIRGDQWIPTDQGLISLFALPVGEYSLDARIRIGDQIVHEKNDMLRFVIQPPFYQSWWFVFLASVMLVALIWAGMNLYYGETERRKLESIVKQRTQSLDETIRELEQKNGDLEQFAYIASHDLKSPLRGMIGHLQLIQRRVGGSLGDQANSSLEYAIGEAKRLFEMVNDLLDFASIGSERMEKKHVSLNRLIQNLEKSMIVQIRERGARLVYHDLPMVDIVPSQYEALFRNLIDNGIKFNESDEPTITIDVKATEGYWIFIVADNGIGMDEQYIKKAFELYGRLNPDYPGTGIGLAICKRVVERHGGSIWYESQPGKGTSFLFSLPKK